MNKEDWKYAIRHPFAFLAARLLMGAGKANGDYVVDCPHCHRTTTVPYMGVIYAEECKFCSYILQHDGDDVKAYSQNEWDCPFGNTDCERRNDNPCEKCEQQKLRDKYPITVPIEKREALIKKYE